MTMNEHSPNPGLPDDREPTLRQVAMPRENNTGGSIFGGWLMSQVDIAAGIVAIRRAGGRVATVAVNNFHFRAPVLAGDLVSCYASVSDIGRTSLIIHVDVYAQRDLAPEEVLHVADAQLTYVALDGERRPRPVSAEVNA